MLVQEFQNRYEQTSTPLVVDKITYNCYVMAMYVCEIHTKNRQWIVGIFREKATAETFYLQHADSRLIDQKLSTPFFIVESNDAVGVRYEYLTPDDLKTRLTSIVRVEPTRSHHCYMQVYLVNEEIKSEVDVLNSLPSIYVSNEWLKKYDEQGDQLIAAFQTGT